MGSELGELYFTNDHDTTNKVINDLSNLIQSLTTESGVPNLEQANLYLQKLIIFNIYQI